MLFKFFFFLILFFYIVYKIGGYVLRILFPGYQQYRQNYRGTQNYQKSSMHRAPNSNLNIDHMPDKDQRKGHDYKGGDYVDYEEVD